jgi:hypothetical protein
VNLGDITLKVATLKAIADFVEKEYVKARTEAEAAYREHGVKAIAITLPDGQEIGTSTVKKPGPSMKVDEDAFLAWVEEHTPAEVEEYLDSSVLMDQEAIEWARANRDDLLKRRVRRVWRDEKEKQAKANDGCVIDESTGESTKVAEVTVNRPTGAFALSADSHGERMELILAALRAGELTSVVALPIAAPVEDGAA